MKQGKRVSKYKTFFHAGDTGDVIAFLPVIRAMGGGTLILGKSHLDLPREKHAREPMTEARVAFIKPLLESQPYIKRVLRIDGYHDADIDMSAFRTSPHDLNESLTSWQARYAGVQVDLSPWLKVTPSSETIGRTVIARSLRYHNNMFGWTAQLAKAKNPIFIGLPEEHHQFSMTIATLPHRQVKDALEMAQLIAGSNLFIGNQSCPCWLAMAMGHKLIQETWPQCQNSRIERENAEFVLNGGSSSLSKLPWEQ